MTSNFMRQALDLSQRAAGNVSPNPAVGAVLVAGGRVVGTGYTEPPGGRHAEIVALEEAGDAARGSTLFVTLEPCCHQGRTPPCADAIVRAGVSRVVYSLEDPDQRVRGAGAGRLREAGLTVEKDDGALEAAQILETYLKHRTTGLPFVTAKYAASLDGRIAAASGDSRWVSGPEAREWGHSLRSVADAVAVGSATVLADDPLLTARPGGRTACRQPLRIVLDSSGRIDPAARVLDRSAQTFVATTRQSAAAWRASLEEKGARIWVGPQGREGHVDLAALLRELGAMSITSVLVEGGGVLLGSFFDERLVDRVAFVLAPLIVGAAGAPAAVAGRGASQMKDVTRLRDVTYERLGEDMAVSGYPIRRGIDDD